MANFSLLLVIVFLLFFCISQKCQANDNKRNGMSFKLIHRNSLDSPLYSSKFEFNNTHQFEFNKHFETINNDSLPKSDNHIIRPSLHRPSLDGLYFIELGIGTFSSSVRTHKTYLLLDTAGGFIWTQCQGCDPCFTQKDPVFPRNESQTYHALPCNQCPEGTRCEQDHCTIDEAYLHGSSIHGIVATETFSFESKTGGSQRLPNLRFTCVIRSKHLSFGDSKTHIASGIFSMSRHPASFISQVGERFGGRFSYCLIPNSYQGQQPHMFLRFGHDVPSSGLMPKYRTPLVPGHRHNNNAYYLDLRAISIGTQKLNIDPSVFQLRTNVTGGCFMDTGATSSYLIDAAYVEFWKVLKQTIETKNPGISVSLHHGLIIGFEPRPGQKAEFPTVTFHFENDVKLVVEPESYLFRHDILGSPSYFLKIYPSHLHTIIGANLQENHQITYDTLNSVAYFTPTDCLSYN